ncbi:lipopolysaccharide biosynthesis protein [Spongiimicrobium salis]|uniref:lipopolysaccharide biosynthesis protein n=1 Tax=Spongiimicrobium salis TaxID=1667022 RepID=UPI00374DD250
MNPLKKLFKQTFIYGLATVLPRMLSFLLLPLYTHILEVAGYGEISVIFAWFAIFNVILAYGMETAFFRFYHKAENRQKVVSTALISIVATTAIFLIFGLGLQGWISEMAGIELKYIQYALCIVALDALVIIPFAWLRATEKPMRYAIVKMINVAIYLGLNVFFLLVLPDWATNDPNMFLADVYQPNYEVSYIFISNLVASGVTLILMLEPYVKQTYIFDTLLWKKMMGYGLPVLVAGVAFTINEVFDRILLKHLLEEGVADAEIGMYSACYKLALFMTLFATAFRMGIEPFFFSHSSSKNPQKTYAQITNYFVILGSIILLGVIVFSDVLKVLFVRNSDYWEAMSIVPIITLAAFFLGIYHNLSVWYKITDKTRYGALISVIGAIMTIGINYAFIPSIGYMASAIATLVAYGTMMVLSYAIGKRHYPIPYNFRKIVFYLSISILFSILSFYVFNRSLIWGSLLLFLFLGMVYKLENEQLRKIFLRK